MRNFRWSSLVVIGLLLWIVGCQTSGPGPVGKDGQFTSDPAKLAEKPKESALGFVFTLAEGNPDAAALDRPKEAKLTPLSAPEVAALLKRLPEFKAKPESTDFALREKSLPPPRTGDTKLSAFPPPVPVAKPDTAASGELEVLRHAPEGEVPIAPQLSVTFNQPMVAVTSHQELAKLSPPVQLTPQPEGAWRWIGTRTVLFDPKPSENADARFPMSTEYKVEVPSGTKSTSGKSLAKAQSWSFTTPTVTMVSSAPNGGPHDLDPLLWVVFNQEIDRDAVLKTIKLEGGGSNSIRLAQAGEIENSGLDPKQAKRWVAFKATEKLKSATNYTVKIGPGTPSAEGPLTTKEVQSFSFSTYDPLKVEDHGCGYGSDCPPLTPFYIRFNNPLDLETFDPAWVKITPEIPKSRVEANGNGISIRGESKGRTTYTVTIEPKLQDSFGQTLAQKETLTFKTGSAQPDLAGPGELLVTLDPARQDRYPVYVMNHQQLKVRVHAVEPKDWNELRKRLQEETDTHPFVPPGQEMVNTTLATGAKTDELTEVAIDLKPALHKGKGMAVVTVETPSSILDFWQRRQQRVVRWVQATDLGLDAAVDPAVMQVFTSTLKSGAPKEGVKLELLSPEGQSTTVATSGDNGTASLNLPDRTVNLLVARSGEDVSILPQSDYLYGYGGGWQKSTPVDTLQWSVLDDRKMYRPDEKVSIRGWVRRRQAGPKGDIVGLKGELKELSWRLQDAVGNEVLKGSAKVSAQGSFDFDFTLPKTINLGYTQLYLSGDSSVSNSSTSHSFQVQEFRRPEFEVSASGPDSSLIGSDANVNLDAKYYSGGGLPGAPVTWNVTTAPGSYSPPGHEGYTFGSWTPWWDWHGRDLGEAEAAPASKTFESRTDSSGKHYLKMDFLSVNPARPTVVTAEASVTDVNRQAWSASTSVLVHPSENYVGLKTKETFVEKGEPLEVELIAVDREGKALTDVPVEIACWRNDYKMERGVYRESREDLQSETVTSAAEGSKIRFKTDSGGTYTVKARVTDAKGRPNETTLTVWVSGAEAPPSKNVEQQVVTLVPNQKEYKAGETAEILVQAPFSPAEGTVSYRRSGLLKSERISLKDGSAVVKVPIEEAHVPNLSVQVDLVGVSGESKQPAYASGSLNLLVPPLARTFAVEVKPVHPSTNPGAKTSIEVLVKDAAGRPVAGSEVALFAVDEAVLALTGYQFPNPLDVFYAQRSSDVSDVHSRQYVVLSKLEADKATFQDFANNGRVDNDGLRGGGGNKGYANYDSMAGTMSAPAMEAAPAPTAQSMRREKASRADDLEADFIAAKREDKAQQPTGPIKMRTDFNPTALFAPSVKTDASGKAAVPFKLPDNLTRYRLVAIATDGGKQFGKGESALVARLPLMVRPSAPRFLNFGDSFELPVVLQNQTDTEMDVQVAARAVNLKFTGAQGYSLKIPANDRVEARFPSATDRAGKVNLQVGAVASSGADAAEVSLPVWTPATTEAFATYGEIDADGGAIAQPVKPPGEVFPQFGGLEITTTSTALQSLTDAFLYLTSYPFDCAEQVSSRLLGIAALRDVLWAFQAEGVPDEASLKEQVKKDMDRLAMLQQSNGGFGFWPTSSENWPYISVHVAHAMARAKAKGYEVPETLLSRSQSYLSNVESYIPGWYHIDTKRVIRAYALYVRQLLGDTASDSAAKEIRAKVKALAAEAGGVTKLPIEATAFLYSVMAKDPVFESERAEVRKFLNNKVTETAGNAHFVAGYDEQSGYVILQSDRRVDGILLEAMIKDQPKNDLIPKIARGLLAHRKRGRWENTQDNCFVLLALDKYFHTYENVTPNFVARAWLGDEFAGEQTFKGREKDYKSVRVPMSYLADKGEKTLTLAKQGQGRLYYRLGMDYAPKDLKMPPADHGFAVERRYEGVDNVDDVKQDEDGTWRIKAGAKVRVTLSMVATARRYHVALVDPIPAGLEPMNPALAVTGTVPNDPSAQASRGPWWYWLGTWYEHQNMRDERVEAFTSLLWEGVHSYTYVARATTPGNFVVPPTKAEEMYAPETFGRSASDRVIVE